MIPLPSRHAIDQSLFEDESHLVNKLAHNAELSESQKKSVKALATRLVQKIRNERQSQGSIDAFMQEYALSSEEGVVLMCLAEALLRIPDAATADKLIADKLGGKAWDSHLGKSDSLFVNASTWGLMLTGRLISLTDETTKAPRSFLTKLISRSGEPVIRASLRQAMRIMGRQFVLGRTIEEALSTAGKNRGAGYCHSFDMLGESAMTAEDARRYFASYQSALRAVGKAKVKGDVFAQDSLSVKLSALHPRYEVKTSARVLTELYETTKLLALEAKNLGVGLTIDAEEVARLDLSLELFGRLCHDRDLASWNGLGLAVQAYSRRAKPVLEWLAQVAKDSNRVMPVRLVKGAYWDTEIKRAQESGFENFPLFTRKVSTDVSYLACAQYLLGNSDRFFPQFATHNAHTLAAISIMANPGVKFEFQRLHGMGESLHDQMLDDKDYKRPCRIYAPVGSHEDLLAYLVRRLLENGANTSFVNRLADDEAPIDQIISDPVEDFLKLKTVPHPRIAVPARLFGARTNSHGEPLWRDTARSKLLNEISTALKQPLQFNGGNGTSRTITSPHDRRMKVGSMTEVSEQDAAAAMTKAATAFPGWDALGGERRAMILERAADLYEQNRSLLMGLLVREAGKTIDAAQADLREAVDFLRYYASEARGHFAGPTVLPGPTGELNEISLHGRGVFACISPWNFPLAIFTGQVAAALAAGNAVVAKPAEQTPLVAHEAVRFLHQAGVPTDVLHFLPGDGAKLGGVILKHKALAGVAFTGSNDTARIINRILAERDGAIPVLIAETGGMNAMIVDSSALPEQAIRDVVASAFDSAGQRCSAARILFVQDDVASRVIKMLRGAMEELNIGDPMNYATDIGPVIDEEARAGLEAHKNRMKASAKTIADLQLPEDTRHGTFVAPAAYEVSTFNPLQKEVFGPILHVVSYASDRMNEVCDAINNTGYGLTCGLHTRIESFADEIRKKLRVGNLYINRNQIGAVVGSQPFGGEGLSGTGPKAGGPHYLLRFATERVCSNDKTASGGNAALMTIDMEGE